MQDLKFLRPRGFTALRSVTVPYVHTKNPEGIVPTSELIAKHEYGLQAELLRDIKPLIFNVGMNADYTEHFQTELANSLVQEKGGPDGSRLDIAGWRELGHNLAAMVRVIVEDVDSSDLGTTIEPRPIILPVDWL